MLTDGMLPARNSGRAYAAAAEGPTGSHWPLAAVTADRSRTFWLLASAALTVLLFAAALTLFEPFWESNDDSGMSMIAHGYGSVKAPSVSLLFQNILIGGLLQVLPRIDGVLPYSWVTLLLMFCSSWALLYFSVRSGGSPWLAVVALALVLARIVAAPQFTITAGILAAAGVLALHSHTRAPSLGALVAGVMLVAAGYLVRAEESFFVLAVSLPFVPWKKLPMGRWELTAAAAVLAFVVCAGLFDYWHYQGPEWEVFWKMDSLRLMLTDYNYKNILMQQPGLLQTHGFSTNDIQLIEDWFYFDPAVADPERLRALLAEVHTSRVLVENVPLLMDALKALYDPSIAPLMISAVTISALSRCRTEAAMSWGIFLVVILGFALIGRPAVLRTYYPIPILLLFLTLACGLPEWLRAPMYRVIPLAVLLGMLALTLRLNIAENQKLQERSRLVQEDIATLDRSPQPVVWGSTYPYEIAMPVLARDTQSSSFSHYGLGWDSLAPYSLENFKGSEWRDLVDRLARDHDIPFIAARNEIALLSVYCREHHNKELIARETPLSTFTVYHVTCGKY